MRRLQTDLEQEVSDEEESGNNIPQTDEILMKDKKSTREKASIPKDQGDQLKVNDNGSKNKNASNKFVPSDAAVDVGNKNNVDMAAMLLNDASTLRQQIPLTHSASSSWYQPYEATLFLILILHLIFLHQWNRRKTKKDVMVSYRILVQKKHWYRGWLAMLSHPPADNSDNANNRSRRRPVLAVNLGNEETMESSTSAQQQLDHNTYERCCNLCKQIMSKLKSWLQPVLVGHLSGLPLLAYNAHVLWSCRALEPTLCSSSWEYGRVLLGLTLVALLLELRLSHNVLAMNRGFVGFGSQPYDSYSTSVVQTRKAVLNRSIGTCTMLSAALLIVYRGVFPYVSLKVLPIYWPASNNLDPAFSYWLCIVLLVALSWRSHPVTSVLCGTMSGLFWTAGLTSFLSNAYWGSCLIMILVIMSALSMRSSSPRLAAYVPCIDYVSWDRRGVIRQRGEGESRHVVETNNDSDDEGNTRHNDDNNNDDQQDVEMGPLLRRRSSSRGSSVRGDEDRLALGRLPLDALDMDDTTAMQVPGTSSNARGLSRRGGSSGYHGIDDTASSPTAR